MDELDKNIPEDFWRKTFDEAAETPPPRVWDSIERRLDESSGPKILPLWRFGQASSWPILWGTGIAAALALLLVGWWIIDAPSANQPTTQLQSSRQTDRVAFNETDPTRSPSHKSSSQSPGGLATVDGPSANVPPSFVDPKRNLSTQRSAETEGFVAQTMARSGQRTYWLRRSPALSPTETSDHPARAMSQRFSTPFTPVERTLLAERLPGQLEAMTFQEIRGKSFRLRSPGPIQRIVWARPAELPMESILAKGKRKTKELWASVSAMPGSFNPMVSLRSAPMPTASYNSVTALTNSNQPTVNSRASFSVAYQASAGIQLNERWSVESGIGYLAGRSTVEAPVQGAVSNFAQLTNTNRDAASNAYVNALRSSVSTNMAYSASPATSNGGITYDLIAGNYVNQAQQALTNDYQYVQVPVQVGYQLRPRKKVSLAVLGGLLTNIFVRNTVGSDVVVKAKDGIYKPVSLAASMGARVRYRPSGRWSASMAGLYQPSLSSGTEADSQVQSRPTTTGMSFGVDYHF